MDHTIISLKDASKVIGLTPASVWRHVVANHLPGVRIGNSWGVTTADVRQFIQLRAEGQFCSAGRPKRNAD